VCVCVTVCKPKRVVRSKSIDDQYNIHDKIIKIIALGYYRGYSTKYKVQALQRPVCTLSINHRWRLRHDPIDFPTRRIRKRLRDVAHSRRRAGRVPPPPAGRRSLSLASCLNRKPYNSAFGTTVYANHQLCISTTLLLFFCKISLHIVLLYYAFIKYINTSRYITFIIWRLVLWTIRPTVCVCHKRLRPRLPGTTIIQAAWNWLPAEESPPIQDTEKVRVLFSR